MMIIAVDDIPENAHLITRLLTGHEVREFHDPYEALEFCSQNPFDLLVTDQKMPGMNGTDLVRAVREKTDDFMAIIVSAYADTEYVIDAVNTNLVYRYVLKPLDVDDFRHQVRRALERLELERTNKALTKDLERKNAMLQDELARVKRAQAVHEDFFTSREPVMHKLFDRARMCAASDQPVLILGETGTGKELLARAIHDLSQRSDKPFVAVNCSAFSETLFETELFGHEKGAFTGAQRQRDGFLKAADGGTLFLDEIGDLPQPVQGKLLRVIQFGTYHRVGSTAERRVNVRFLSATNADLMSGARADGFRSDLYYRLNTFVLEIPPLRERKEDILPLLNRIAERRGMRIPILESSAELALCAHSYPGNVRELESIVEQLCAYAVAHEIDRVSVASLSKIVHNELPKQCREKLIESQQLPETSETEQGLPQPEEASAAEEALDGHSLSEYLDHVKRRIILSTFAEEGKNISRTARRLGMSRQGLKNALSKYGTR